jgi:hypothetical protein
VLLLKCSVQLIPEAADVALLAALVGGPDAYLEANRLVRLGQLGTAAEIITLTQCPFLSWNATTKEEPPYDWQQLSVHAGMALRRGASAYHGQPDAWGVRGGVMGGGGRVQDDSEVLAGGCHVATAHADRPVVSHANEQLVARPGVVQPSAHPAMCSQLGCWSAWAGEARGDTTVICAGWSQ